jgi:hypothetical protein
LFSLLIFCKSCKNFSYLTLKKNIKDPEEMKHFRVLGKGNRKIRLKKG